MEKILDAHIKKEQIIQEQRQILSKYGYIQNNHTKAFYKMCDMGLNAWPKETADKEAVSDYEKFIELIKEYNSINSWLRSLRQPA